MDIYIFQSPKIINHYKVTEKNITTFYYYCIITIYSPKNLYAGQNFKYFHGSILKNIIMFECIYKFTLYRSYQFFSFTKFLYFKFYPFVNFKYIKNICFD